MPPPRTAAADVERFGAAGVGRTGMPLTPENRELWRQAFSPGSPVARGARGSRRVGRPGSPVRPVGGRNPRVLSRERARAEQELARNFDLALRRAGERARRSGRRRRRYR